MVWMAIGIGLASFAALSWLARQIPGRSLDVAERVFRMAAGSGLSALAAVAAFEGSRVGAFVAAAVATTFAIDLVAVWRAVRAAQPSTVTPFQKAT